MNHTCTRQTDLDELIGMDCYEDQRVRFRYGPLTLAMKEGLELVLDDSKMLSPFLRAKLSLLFQSLTIEETNEVVHPGAGFHVIYR